MKPGIKQHLEKLRKIGRGSYHPLIHQIHKKHKISKKTLFYIKEYGKNSNIPQVIIKESLSVLLFASVLSAFGGLMLENIKQLFISIAPLVILMPTLNGMIGSYGTVVSSRFSTLLHEGKVRDKILTPELKKLFIQVLIIAIFISLISIVFSGLISRFTSNFQFNFIIYLKLLLIILVDVIVLVLLIFLISIFGGLHFFKNKEDPNNFLIPLTTSIADCGNMIILAVLVFLLF